MVETTDKKSQNWGMACHLIALTAFLGVPLGHLLGPLTVWLCLRNTYPNVDVQGREALNFQISMTIYGIVAGLLCFVVIGFVLLPILIVADLVLVIVAAVKASSGESYQYPFTLRLIN